MIQQVSLTNFKCFKSITLELRAASVLAGVNGAGKSTIIQALLSLRQSWDSGSLIKGRIELAGPLTDLGTAGEVYCADPISDDIRLAFRASDGSAFEMSCVQSESTSRQYSLRTSRGLHDDERNFQSLGLFSEPFNYLHAERVGPRKVFQIAPDGEHPLSVGKHGEAAPSIVASEYRETPVHSDHLLLPSADGKEYSTLQYQWPLWMARVFPGFDAESEIYARADQVRLGLALQRHATGRPLFVRPTNTGFGLSFVLGIVVAGLVARPDTVLIVENPEAHLHPRAQSMMGEFLGRVAAGGAQVIVETHSEHVVNGLRRMVKQSILDPDELRLFYFARNGDNLEPSVVPISVSHEGGLSMWPEGFFDQLDDDLNSLLS